MSYQLILGVLSAPGQLPQDNLPLGQLPLGQLLPDNYPLG